MKPAGVRGGALRAVGRVLHSILRVLGALFVVAVLAAVGLGVYAYRTFSPENARALAVGQLTDLLSRQVSINRLVLSPRGFKVLGLRVRDKRPGAADLVDCDSALVTVDLGALLRRRLQIDAVVLQSPRISLRRDPDGRWALNGILGRRGSGSGSSLLPAALASAQTVVRGGTLLVDDEKNGNKVALKDLSLRVDGFAPDKPFAVEASFSSEETLGGRTLEAAVAASGRVDLAGLNWSSATATADRFSVDLQGIPFTGRATLSSFLPPRLDVRVASPAIGPAGWKSLLGRDVALSLPPVRWSAQGWFPALGMLEVDTITARTPAGEAYATGLLDFEADSPTLSVEAWTDGADLARAASWSPSWAKRRLTGRASGRISVTGWWGRLQARDGSLSLRDFGASWGRRKLSGADVDATASDEFSRVTATASKGRVEALGDVFSDVALALSIKDQNLSLDRLSLRWAGSNIRVRGRVEHLSKPKQVVLSATADKIDWESAARLVADFRAALSSGTARAGGDSSGDRPWLRTFKYAIPRGFPDTAGHVHVGEISHPDFTCRNFDAVWTLRGVTPALDKVNGEARLRFGPGQVKDIPAVQNANQFLRVVFLPFVFMHKMNSLSVFSAGTAYPKSLGFRLIDGEYGASKGVVTTRYFHLDSDQLVAYAQGTADFAREKVDMNILTRLTGYRGTLPEWWVDEEGRPAIGFRVAGDINSPDLQPRFKKIGAHEIEDDVAAARARSRARFQALETRLKRLESK
ncbi:MAG: AsmA family protein [Elusimicrobia bacterium]|nr:AsmA family protein [Elusimicrobiota bacterium]